MANWLSRLRRLNPRFVAAGLTVGLVAGPLGGALAAGTAGLMAGASLATTLGTLGATLGAALSLSGGKPQAGPAAITAQGDGLGLPVRSGVMRAMVLLVQDGGEPQVVTALQRLAELPEGSVAFDGAERARAYLAAARRLGAAL
jgi:hypothetical protein